MLWIDGGSLASAAGFSRAELEPSCREALAGSVAASSELRRLLNIAPSTAVPTEPPIERNSDAPEVATPRSEWSTAFCTASTRTCITSPSPSPSTNM